MSLSQSRPLTEVRVVDLEGRPVKTAEVSAKRQPQEGGVKFGFNEILNVWSGEKLDSGPWLFSVDAPGFESQIQNWPVTPRGVQALFILGRPGLPFYHRGSAKVPFDPAVLGELIAVSMTPGMESQLADLSALARELGLEPVEEAASQAEGAAEPVRIHNKLQVMQARFSEVSSVKVAPPQNPRQLRMFRAASAADAEAFEKRAAGLPSVGKVGKVVHRQGDSISFLTNEIVVELKPGIDVDVFLRDHEQLTKVRHVAYAGNAFILRAPQLSSSELLPLCNRLAEGDPSVVSAEPNLVSSVVLHFTPNDFAGQLHHPLIESEPAWDIVRANAIAQPLIAVIDEGCDVTHPDFAGNLADQFDFSSLTTTLFSSPHGTMTAGVAAAAFDNGIGIAGVAGMCDFMAIQYPIGGTDEDFADMFVWCAGLDVGHPNPALATRSRGADIISNSWGLGQNRPLSLVVERALDRVTTEGRGGKGCVVLFSAGNDGDDLVVKQPWAAHPNVIAVGSSTIDTPEVKASTSNFGSPLDVCAPGGDRFGATFSTTAGTTPQGGTPGLYAVLGETSCACPQVAGVAAMMLSVNPNLTAGEVRDILQQTAVQIDLANGAYTAGHSDLYGFGRVNARKAVQEAFDRLP